MERKTLDDWQARHKEVAVSLDTLWRIEGIASRVQERIHDDRAAQGALQYVMGLAGSLYAEARRGDPTLPSYYQRYLKPE